MLVIDAAEEVADVRVEHVVAAATQLPCAASPAPASRCARAETRTSSRWKSDLEDRLQHQLRCRLHDTIAHRRDPERPLLPISLRNVPAQDRAAAGTRLRAARRDLLEEALHAVLLDRPRSSGHRRPRRPCSVSPASTLPPGRHSSQMRSYSAWKRRPGCCLAASRSRLGVVALCRSGLRPRGELGPVLPAMPSRLPLRSTRPPPGPLPSGRVIRARPSSGTTTPSDSRCAALDFVLGLYEPPCPDDGLRRRVSRVPCFSLNACCAPYPGGPTRASDVRRRMLPSP